MIAESMPTVTLTWQDGMLQWGRDQMIAERQNSLSFVTKRIRFNGAAIR